VRGHLLVDRLRQLAPVERVGAGARDQLEAPREVRVRHALAGLEGRRPVDRAAAAQVRPRGRARAVPIGQQQRGHLRERLDHQHARHERRAGKVTLEELLVDRHVLHGDQPVAGLVLGDGVHQQGRIAIAQTVDDVGNVDGHDAGHRRIGVSVHGRAPVYRVRGPRARVGVRAGGPGDGSPAGPTPGY